MSYRLYDFGCVQGGFPGVDLACREAARVYLMFDEVRERSPDQAFALGVGAVALDLAPGDSCFESMEPYSFRFLRIVCLDGAVDIKRCRLREYAHPVPEPRCPSDDPELQAILKAAWQTFRTNSIDLFTDCPSRERGGYPCDAWFTARAERILTGESRVERNFLENYFLNDRFSGVPEGMVPHCYPSDRLGKGQYIPNWGLWLVLQLCDYCQRTGDDALKDLARSRVEALFNWFLPHRNDLGLLENLPGWIFVEWSPANNYTDGISHPTNMLYAHCLDRAAELYERKDWAEQGTRTRDAVQAVSWDGQWYADQSIRVDGECRHSEARSETCQYHAFRFGITTPEQSPDLWTRLRDRQWLSVPATPSHNGQPGNPDNPELIPAGMLFGLLLRLDLLQSQGEWKQLLQETREIFGPMAVASGTLWEHAEAKSSLNHGFASVACEYLIHALKNKPAGNWG